LYKLTVNSVNGLMMYKNF